MVKLKTDKLFLLASYPIAVVFLLYEGRLPTAETISDVRFPKRALQRAIRQIYSPFTIILAKYNRNRAFFLSFLLFLFFLF